MRMKNIPHIGPSRDNGVSDLSCVVDDWPPLNILRKKVDSLKRKRFRCDIYSRALRYIPHPCVSATVSQVINYRIIPRRTCILLILVGV